MLQQQFGEAIEQQILINLAQAARIYPKLARRKDSFDVRREVV